MKKIKLLTGLTSTACLTACLTPVMTGCSCNKKEIGVTLSSISVATKPTKTTYIVGDKLDLAGMKVTATYSDGSAKDVTSSCTTNPATTEQLTESNNKVTVSYKEGTVTKTDEFTIIVDAIAVDFDMSFSSVDYYYFERRTFEAGKVYRATMRAYGAIFDDFFVQDSEGGNNVPIDVISFTAGDEYIKGTWDEDTKTFKTGGSTSAANGGVIIFKIRDTGGQYCKFSAH